MHGLEHLPETTCEKPYWLFIWKCPFVVNSMSSVDCSISTVCLYRALCNTWKKKITCLESTWTPLSSKWGTRWDLAILRTACGRQHTREFEEQSMKTPEQMHGFAQCFSTPLLLPSCSPADNPGEAWFTVWGMALSATTVQTVGGGHWYWKSPLIWCLKNQVLVVTRLVNENHSSYIWVSAASLAKVEMTLGWNSS